MSTQFNLFSLLLTLLLTIVLPISHAYPSVHYNDQMKGISNKIANLSSVCDQSIANSKKNQGKSFDICTATSECGGNRFCIAILAGNEAETTTCEQLKKQSPEKDIRCLCIPSNVTELAACEPPLKCPEGEACGFHDSTQKTIAVSLEFCVSEQMNLQCYTELTGSLQAGNSNQPSVSPSASPTPSNTPTPTPTRSPSPSPSRKPSPSSANAGAVCIAMKHLGEFGRNELVFDQDQVTNVLCDRNESCATPGHIVIWQGRGMMMKTYCGKVGGCRYEKMEVNSPRWGKGKSVKSMSDGLLFSVYAARYESKVEEYMLERILRIEKWSYGQ